MSAGGGWIWYELLTSDVQGALAFYGKVLGWTPVPHAAVEGYYMFRSPVSEVGGIMAMAADAGITRPVWLGYIHVADVDATVGAAQRDGAALCVPPTDIPGVGRFAMIRDPQKVATYVMAPAPVGGESRSFAALPGHCQWNELVTSDPEGALAFYTRHFGWQKGEAMPMGPLGTYQLLVNDGIQIGAIMKRGRPDAPPIWRFYFGVEDIDAAVKAAQAAGGKLVDQVMPTPNGFAAVIIDPQGAEFGIAGPRKG